MVKRSVAVSRARLLRGEEWLVAGTTTSAKLGAMLLKMFAIDARVRIKSHLGKEGAASEGAASLGAKRALPSLFKARNLVYVSSWFPCLTGWRFNSEGACTKMPQTVLCRGVGVQSLPVAEKDGEQVLLAWPVFAVRWRLTYCCTSQPVHSTTSPVRVLACLAMQLQRLSADLSPRQLATLHNLST